MQRQLFTIILLVVLAGLLTVGLLLKPLAGVSPSVDKKNLAELGFFLFDSPRNLEPIPLRDLDGSDVTLINRHQQWQLVNLGYMFCPDICPINLRFMSELKQNWDSADKGINFEITHITFDPERDTPDRLSKYLDYINPDYAGLTGELDNIRKVAQQLNVVFIHEQPDEYGNYFISHSDSLALVNPQGQYIGLFKGPYDKEKVYKALEILLQ